MKQRTLIIGIAVATLVILMTVAIFAAVGSPRQLTLTSEPNISSVTVNGASRDFQQNMKIDYKEATTIEVAQNGYDEFKVTLDPTKDDLKTYAIKLSKKTDAPVGSQNYDLLKAAEKTDDGSGLILDDQLNVAIKDTKKFSADYVTYTVTPKDGNGDTGLIIAQKHNGTYEIVLGPGTSFSETDLLGLPTDLVNYLKSIGVGGATE